MQANFLWRYKRTRPYRPEWMYEAIKAYKTQNGVILRRFILGHTWRTEAEIIWVDK